MHWGPIEKRDLILGVVVPGVVLVPFLVLGLLGLAVFLLGSRPFPPETAALLPVFALLGLGALAFFVSLGVAIWIGPGRLREDPIRRYALTALLVLGILVTTAALLAQVPSLRWALGDRRHATSLIVLVPGVLALLGPILVGAKYAWLLVRRAPTGPAR